MMYLRIRNKNGIYGTKFNLKGVTKDENIS